MSLKITDILIASGRYMLDEHGFLLFDENGRLIENPDYRQGAQEAYDKRYQALYTSLADQANDKIDYKEDDNGKLVGNVGDSKKRKLYSLTQSSDFDLAAYVAQSLTVKNYNVINSFFQYLLQKGGALSEEYAAWAVYSYDEILEMEADGVVIPDLVLEWAHEQKSIYEPQTDPFYQDNEMESLLADLDNQFMPKESINEVAPTNDEEINATLEAQSGEEVTQQEAAKSEATETKDTIENLLSDENALSEFNLTSKGLFSKITESGTKSTKMAEEAAKEVSGAKKQIKKTVSERNQLEEQSKTLKGKNKAPQKTNEEIAVEDSIAQLDRELATKEQESLTGVEKLEAFQDINTGYDEFLGKTNLTMGITTTLGTEATAIGVTSIVLGSSLIATGTALLSNPFTAIEGLILIQTGTYYVSFGSIMTGVGGALMGTGIAGGIMTDESDIQVDVSNESIDESIAILNDEEIPERNIAEQELLNMQMDGASLLEQTITFGAKSTKEAAETIVDEIELGVMGVLSEIKEKSSDTLAEKIKKDSEKENKKIEKLEEKKDKFNEKIQTAKAEGKLPEIEPDEYFSTGDIEKLQKSQEKLHKMGTEGQTKLGDTLTDVYSMYETAETGDFTGETPMAYGNVTLDLSDELAKKSAAYGLFGIQGLAIAAAAAISGGVAVKAGEDIKGVHEKASAKINSAMDSIGENQSTVEDSTGIQATVTVADKQDEQQEDGEETQNGENATDGVNAESEENVLDRQLQANENPQEEFQAEEVVVESLSELVEDIVNEITQTGKESEMMAADAKNDGDARFAAIEKLKAQAQKGEETDIVTDAKKVNGRRGAPAQGGDIPEDQGNSSEDGATSGAVGAGKMDLASANGMVGIEKFEQYKDINASFAEFVESNKDGMKDMVETGMMLSAMAIPMMLLGMDSGKEMFEEGVKLIKAGAKGSDAIDTSLAQIAESDTIIDVAIAKAEAEDPSAKKSDSKDGGEEDSVGDIDAGNAASKGKEAEKEGKGAISDTKELISGVEKGSEESIKRESDSKKTEKQIENQQKITEKLIEIEKKKIEEAIKDTVESAQEQQLLGQEFEMLDAQNVAANAKIDATQEKMEAQAAEGIEPTVSIDTNLVTQVQGNQGRIGEIATKTDALSVRIAKNHKLITRSSINIRKYQAKFDKLGKQKLKVQEQARKAEEAKQKKIEKDLAIVNIFNTLGSVVSTVGTILIVIGNALIASVVGAIAGAAIVTAGSIVSYVAAGIIGICGIAKSAIQIANGNLAAGLMTLAVTIVQVVLSCVGASQAAEGAKAVASGAGALAEGAAQAASIGVSEGMQIASATISTVQNSLQMADDITFLKTGKRNEDLQIATQVLGAFGALTNLGNLKFDDPKAITDSIGKILNATGQVLSTSAAASAQIRQAHGHTDTQAENIVAIIGSSFSLAGAAVSAGGGAKGATATEKAQISGQMISAGGQFIKSVAQTSATNKLQRGDKNVKAEQIAMAVGDSFAVAGSLISNVAGMASTDFKDMNSIDKTKFAANTISAIGNALSSIASIVAQFSKISGDDTKAAQYMQIIGQSLNMVAAMVNIGADIAAKAQNSAEQGKQTDVVKDAGEIKEDDGAKESDNGDVDVKLTEQKQEDEVEKLDENETTKVKKTKEKAETIEAKTAKTPVDKVERKARNIENTQLAAQVINQVGSIVSMLGGMISGILASKGNKNAEVGQYMQLVGQSLSSVASLVSISANIATNIQNRKQDDAHEIVIEQLATKDSEQTAEQLLKAQQDAKIELTEQKTDGTQVTQEEIHRLAAEKVAQQMLADSEEDDITKEYAQQQLTEQLVVIQAKANNKDDYTEEEQKERLASRFNAVQEIATTQYEANLSATNQKQVNKKQKEAQEIVINKLTTANSDQIGEQLFKAQQDARGALGDNATQEQINNLAAQTVAQQMLVDVKEDKTTKEFAEEMLITQLIEAQKEPENAETEGKSKAQIFASNFKEIQEKPIEELNPNLLVAEKKPSEIDKKIKSIEDAQLAAQIINTIGNFVTGLASTIQNIVVSTGDTNTPVGQYMQLIGQSISGAASVINISANAAMSVQNKKQDDAHEIVIEKLATAKEEEARQELQKQKEDSEIEEEEVQRLAAQIVAQQLFAAQGQARQELQKQKEDSEIKEEEVQRLAAQIVAQEMLKDVKEDKITKEFAEQQLISQLIEIQKEPENKGEKTEQEILASNYEQVQKQAIILHEENTKTAKERRQEAKEQRKVYKEVQQLRKQDLQNLEKRITIEEQISEIKQQQEDLIERTANQVVDNETLALNEIEEAATSPAKSTPVVTEPTQPTEEEQAIKVVAQVFEQTESDNLAEELIQAREIAKQELQTQKGEQQVTEEEVQNLAAQKVAQKMVENTQAEENVKILATEKIEQQLVNIQKAIIQPTATTTENVAGNTTDNKVTGAAAVIPTASETKDKAQQQIQPPLTKEQQVDLGVAQILTQVDKNDLAAQITKTKEATKIPTILDNADTKELATQLLTTKENIEQAQNIVEETLTQAIQDPNEFAQILIQKQEDARTKLETRKGPEGVTEEDVQRLAAQTFTEELLENEEINYNVKTIVQQNLEEQIFNIQQSATNNVSDEIEAARQRSQEYLAQDEIYQGFKNTAIEIDQNMQAIETEYGFNREETLGIFKIEDKEIRNSYTELSLRKKSLERNLPRYEQVMEEWQDGQKLDVYSINGTNFTNATQKTLANGQRVWESDEGVFYPGSNGMPSPVEVPQNVLEETPIISQPTITETPQTILTKALEEKIATTKTELGQRTDEEKEQIINEETARIVAVSFADDKKDIIDETTDMFKTILETANTGEKQSKQQQTQQIIDIIDEIQEEEQEAITARKIATELAKDIDEEIKEDVITELTEQLNIILDPEKSGLKKKEIKTNIEEVQETQQEIIRTLTKPVQEVTKTPAEEAGDAPAVKTEETTTVKVAEANATVKNQEQQIQTLVSKINETKAITKTEAEAIVTPTTPPAKSTPVVASVEKTPELQIKEIISTTDSKDLATKLVEARKQIQTSGETEIAEENLPKLAAQVVAESIVAEKMPNITPEEKTTIVTKLTTQLTTIQQEIPTLSEEEETQIEQITNSINTFKEEIEQESDVKTPTKATPVEIILPEIKEEVIQTLDLAEEKIESIVSTYQEKLEEEVDAIIEEDEELREIDRTAAITESKRQEIRNAAEEKEEEIVNNSFAQFVRLEKRKTELQERLKELTPAARAKRIIRQEDEEAVGQNQETVTEVTTNVEQLRAGNFQNTQSISASQKAAIAGQYIMQFSQMISMAASISASIKAARGIQETNPEKYLQLIGQSVAAAGAVVRLGAETSSMIEQKAKNREREMLAIESFASNFKGDRSNLGEFDPNDPTSIRAWEEAMLKQKTLERKEQIQKARQDNVGYASRYLDKNGNINENKILRDIEREEYSRRVQENTQITQAIIKYQAQLTQVFGAVGQSAIAFAESQAASNAYKKNNTYDLSYSQKGSSLVQEIKSRRNI